MSTRTEAATAKPSVEGCETVPRLFRHFVGLRGSKVAMREKRLGIWHAITWTEYGERARWTGLGLVALGLRPGDVVSIIAENIPEWLYTDMGVLSVGGVANGVYTTDSAQQVEYIVNDSGSRFVFVENEEQLDKLLEVRERCPRLEKIVIFDLEGLRDFQDEQAMSFEALLRLGQEREAERPGEWDRLVETARSEDLAVLIYTSGTTGPPKGAMISHANIIFQISVRPRIVTIGEADELLSFLPLCHIAERTFTTFWPLQSGATVNFAESIETLPDNLREVSPTQFLAVPRVWEKFYSGIAIRMAEATRLGQFAYRVALAIGYRMAECELADRAPSAALRALFWLADLLVLRNVKRLIGISRCRTLVTGAAPISPDLIKWYMALGMTMREVYGQTENVGIATYMPLERIKLGTVGIAEPETEVALSPQNEILVRGPHIFMGYMNKPDKTAETVIDGWLHTGDVGEIDNEGFVRVTDRMKDIIITAGGKNITPSEIENQLKFSPYISDAVVIGERRQYLTCLIMIDHENVVKFAQDHDVPFTNFSSLCRAKEVQDLIWGEIERVNRNFARVETIKKFRLIDQQLTAEDDELTPTMKLKRSFVNQKYKDLIDAMYASS